jgi:hypothetical protein
MRKTIAFLAVIATFALSALPLLAQQKRLSPHETISTVVDGCRVTIVYGRPYSKNPKTHEDRKIWGGLVPYGQVWRTGADEATLLITQKPLVLNGMTTIPAGVYTLYTLPNEDGTAQLIINKQIGQWGTQYDHAEDLARVNLTKEATNQPVDQFTITLNKTPGFGVIRLAWENTDYTVSFAVQK